MRYKKHIYRLSREDFYQFLLQHQRGLELLSEGESFVEFALYEPIDDLEPLEVLTVEVLPPERAFRPIRVKNLMVLPPWLKPLVIRPGSAFGTGLHATTRLCLYMLQDFLKRGWSVLDVGTGTGILAIASKKLGAGRVLAIDVDPLAVEECMHNSKENHARVECLLAEPKDIGESFDLLLANLELEVFRRELLHLKRLFKKVAIFSGIYGRQELDEFLELLGQKPAKIKRLENWHCVVVKT
ncbi:MAG: 50S ribosomal protein L11 methyltransferase [Aquificaceae bacterium]|nr:50S ribosomal protein L11 methyltransferase [Aquificaceae bacterium]MCX8164868.1 50S ribosomal protein L11 methyltransferase [Aquificaceae bacterium]